MLQSICVLYTIINNLPCSVPLEHISYTGRIHSGVARMSLVQKYKNTYSNPIDVVYQMPLLDNIVFESFTAKFGDTEIKGSVKEREQAKQEYQSNVNQGYQAALVSTAKSTTDIMKIEIGNIPPFEEIVLTLVYDAPLESVYEGNWEFKIPSTLTPRYHSPSQPVDQDASPDYFVAKSEYGWDISIIIDWKGGFKKVTSPSHPDEIIVSPIGGDSVMVRLDPSRKHLPNKDFRLVLQDKELFSDVVAVGSSDVNSVIPKYAAMLQFMPDINAAKSESSLRKEKLRATFGEFIFVLDRSGSMMGSRIVQARSSLIYFLKSLPVNSYFNVISFGSEFNALPKSLKYNDKDIEKIIAEIELYDADFGGTEIFQPIQFALDLPPIENYQRNIFLLTDGSVENSDQVVELIKSGTANNQARVFSIGIGNGCSETFIRKTAEVGIGKSLLISDSEEDVQGKIIELLDESLSPALSNFEITFDKKFVKGISPLLNSSSHILRNQPFRLFALIDKSLGSGSTTVKVTYFDSVSGKRREKNFVVDLKTPEQTVLYHRMFLKNLFDGKPTHLSLLDADQKVEEAYTALSVAFQMWAPKYTSYICVSRDSRVDRDFTGKVIVPSIQSVDYSEYENNYSPGYSYMATGSGWATAQAVASVAPRPMMMMKSFGMAAQESAPMMMDAEVEEVEEERYDDEGEGGEEAEALVSELEGAVAEEAPSDATESFDVGSMTESVDEVAVESSKSKRERLEKEVLKYLTKSSTIRGTWKYSQELLEKIGVSLSLKALKKLTKIQNNDDLATVLVSAYILKKSSSSSSTQIILEKARDYLDSKKISWTIVVKISSQLFGGAKI